MRKQKITPFLWFDGQAEEAMHFYVSIFKNSKAGKITYYNEDSKFGKKGDVMSVRFELDGQEFYGLNGGPMYKFSPAISFFVHCDTQAEIDDLWDKLSAGGEINMCGWLQDKYGVSWQIIPDRLDELFQDKDPEKVKRVVDAMLQMTKIDIATLEKAYANGEMVS